jgi:xylitol oxidase
VFADTPITRVVDRIEELFAAAYSVSLFSSFRDPHSVDMIWFKSRLDATVLESEPAALVEGTAAQEDLHPVVGFDPAAATPQRGLPGPWHERLPHFRSGFTPSAGHEIQSELLLPRSLAAQVLEALSAIAPGFAPALQVFEMRTIAADDLWLSPSHGRDSVAAHFTWHPSAELVAPALELVQTALAPFDPRPHWGKVFTGWDTDRVLAAYPRLPQFRDLRDRLDPERHFANDFVGGLLGD